MKKKICSVGITVLFVTKAFAEGQDGLETFIVLTYIFFIVLYSIIGAGLLKLTMKFFKINTLRSKWFYFAIAFCTVVLFALIMGDDFIPFF